MSLRNKRIFWAVYFLVIVVLAFVIPFTLFRDTVSFNGAFLFWCIFALAAIAGVAKITANWNE